MPKSPILLRTATATATTTSLATATAIASLLVIFGAPALAQTSDSPYYYGGLAVGQSRAKLNEERIATDKFGPGVSLTGIQKDNKDTGYKIFGGTQMNRYFALEGGYFRLGEFNFNATTAPTGTLNGRVRVQGLNLDLVGTLPLTENFSALARIGGQYAQTRDNFSASGAVAAGNPSPRHNGGGYKAGVGLQYALGNSMLVRGEVERYRIDDAVGRRSNIDVATISLVFPFGRAPAAAPRPVAMAAPAYVAPAPAPMPAPVIVAAAPQPAPVPPPKRVSFSAESLFGFGQASLRTDGRTTLDAFAKDLSGTQFDTIAVEGHTDRLGSSAFNQKLSEQRAQAVKAYLVESGHLDAMKISTAGKGETMPVTTSAECKGTRQTPALILCLQRDRRVDVEVTGTR